MIMIRFNGGLGNQMFQYAAGLALAEKFNTGLVADLGDYSETGHPFMLDKFRVNLKSAEIRDYACFEPKSGLAGMYSRLFVKPRIVSEPSFSYNKEIMKAAGRNTYLFGYWQCQSYFSHIRKHILNDFLPVNTPQKNTIEILNKIKSSANTVSLHIRRGDYISNPKTNTFHGTCSIEYYKQATALISERLEEPNYFVFSDDIAWAIQNIKPSNRVHYVQHTTVETAWEDLIMMKQCNHNIIANSSFSWWGAWLSENPDKIVIAPKQWFANEEMNAQTSDLIPEDWIRM
jgi:hypothetical protein